MNFYCIRGVMVSMLVLSAVDRGFQPRSGQTKDYNIGICCFSAKHSALRRKNKNWLGWNRDKDVKWCDMYIYNLLFQWASTIKIQLKNVDLIILLKITLFLPLYSWKIAELALNNYHLLTHSRFTVCTEIAIILETVRFTIRGGRLRYKRYNAHFLKKK